MTGRYESAVYDSADCVTYRNKGVKATYTFNLKLGSQQDKTSCMWMCGVRGQNCYDHSITLWQQTQLAAEAAYDRSDNCSFTSFIGYEWTGNPMDGLKVQNLHRNVLFANAVVPERPFDYLSTPYPEQLWNKLSAQCKDLDTGGENCDVLTIPHNSNMSNGLMFADSGQIDASYAQKRALYEPLVEVVQHKGSSECQIGGSDEQCGFEYVPYGDLGGGVLGFENPPKDKSFVRHALKEGLAFKQNLGGNPFKYGMIGSTDTHIGAAGNVKESTYQGNGGAFKTGEPAEVLLEPTEQQLQMYIEQHAGQYQLSPRLSFEQLYFSNADNPDDAHWKNIAYQLNDGSVDSASLGDSSLMPREMKRVDRKAIAKFFGHEFADKVEGLSPGQWQGSIKSAVGYHLVKVTAKFPAELPQVKQVYNQVLIAWQQSQRDQFYRHYLQKMRQQYFVQVEGGDSIVALITAWWGRASVLLILKRLLQL